MSVKIAILVNPKSTLGKLTEIFTGCPAYHIGFLDEDNNRFYDMNLLFRRRIWPYYDLSTVELYNSPVSISTAYLEHKLETDTDYYGIIDYALFTVRGIARILGIPMTSHKGAICSRKVNEVLIECGWNSPWSDKMFPPSPCDFRKLLKGQKCSD